jgi:hypothetical protein
VHIVVMFGVVAWRRDSDTDGLGESFSGVSIYDFKDLPLKGAVVVYDNWNWIPAHRGHS